MADNSEPQAATDYATDFGRVPENSVTSRLVEHLLEDVVAKCVQCAAEINNNDNVVRLFPLQYFNLTLYTCTSTFYNFTRTVGHY